MADAILPSSGIYIIGNILTNKVYVGSACTLKSRIRTHRARLNLKKHHSLKLQNSWNKHGHESFVFEVIEYVEDKTNLIVREQFWMDYYKAATTEGYNVALIAGSSLGIRHTAETRAKVSAANKGRKMPPESVARGASARTGRKHSLESIAKMTGKEFTEDRKNNISKGKLGKKQDPLKIAKRSERKFSASHIENLSKAMKGRKLTPEWIAKREATRKANRLAKLGL